MSMQRRRGGRGRPGAWPAPRGLDLVRLRGALRFGYGGPAVDACGVYVTGPDGEKYLDAAGGAEVPLGHRHPAVVAALREALDGPVAGSPLLADLSHLALADRVAALEPGGLVALGVFTGGTAALEAAVAVARAVTGRERVVTGGEAPAELWPDRLDEALAEAAAVIVEPLGPATLALPPEGEPARIAAAAGRCGALVIADERRLGVGRVGTLLAAEGLGLRADLAVVGGLGGGLVPVSLLLGSRRAAAAVESAAGEAGLQEHGAALVVDESWAGPLACAVATATLDSLVQGDWPARGAAAGRALGRALAALEAEAPDAVTEVRGIGLAWAIECAGPEVAEELVRSLALDRILVAPPPRGGRVVRLLPPLVVEPRELDFVASSIGRALEDA